MASVHRLFSLIENIIWLLKLFKHCMENDIEYKPFACRFLLYTFIYKMTRFKKLFIELQSWQTIFRFSKVLNKSKLKTLLSIVSLFGIYCIPLVLVHWSFGLLIINLCQSSLTRFFPWPVKVNLIISCINNTSQTQTSYD